MHPNNQAVARRAIFNLLQSAIFWLFLVPAPARAQMAPTIVSNASSIAALAGTNISFQIETGGSGPLSYQWLFNGTNLPMPIVTTIAGDGQANDLGDGGPAPQAGVNSPWGCKVDSSGNIYIAEFGGNRVRKIDAQGIIHTIAGTGAAGFSGDGGPATNAMLNGPAGVAVATNGDVYISDYENMCIRKIDHAGNISTVAGEPLLGGYTGDGVAATNTELQAPYGLCLDGSGQLYVADSNNGLVRKIDTNGIISTIAQGISMEPTDVACDSNGNVYIADRGYNRVDKVDTNGVFSVFAGNMGTTAVDGVPATESGMSWPTGVTTDASGNVYIAEFYGNRVRLVNSQGIISTISGNGQTGELGDNSASTNATYDYLSSVALDSLGNIYVADSSNNRIRKIGQAGSSLVYNEITTNLAGPYQVAVSNAYGSVTSAPVTLTVLTPPSITSQPLVGTAVAGANVTYIVTANGTAPLDYTWLFDGTAIFDSGTNSIFTVPGIVSSNAGTYSVVVTNAYGSVTSVVGVLAVKPSVAFQSQPSNQVAVAGTPLMLTTTVGGRAPFEYLWYFNATNLLQDGTNASYSLASVQPTDAGSYTVVVENAFSSITSAVAQISVVFPPVITNLSLPIVSTPGAPLTLAVGVDGIGPFTYQWRHNGTNLPNETVATVTGHSGGGVNGNVGDGGYATNAYFFRPEGVALDRLGNIYVADTENHRIRKINPNGIVTTVAGNGQTTPYQDNVAATNTGMGAPNCVAVDWSGSGAFYFCDNQNRSVRYVDPAGEIHPYAGMGTNPSDVETYATNAEFVQPTSVALTASGLYITDVSSNGVRLVDSNGIITTVAGGGTNTGDGAFATNSTVRSVQSVISDKNGGFYFSESEEVWHVDGSGIMHRIAGTNHSGSSDSGLYATNAILNSPAGLAIDPLGRLALADAGNGAALRLDEDGILRTIAGGGSLAGGGGKYATNVFISSLRGLAFDVSGNLYMTDGGGIHRVLLYASYPTLRLNSASVGDSGNYDVIVSTPYASITSSVVQVTITSNPVISAVSFGGGGQFSFQFSGVTGQNYVVQATTNLSDPNSWGGVFTNTFDTNGQGYLIDSASSQFQNRYYRVQLP